MIFAVLIFFFISAHTSKECMSISWIHATYAIIYFTASTGLIFPFTLEETESRCCVRIISYQKPDPSGAISGVLQTGEGVLTFYKIAR